MPTIEELWQNYTQLWLKVINGTTRDFDLPQGPIVPFTASVLLLQFFASVPVDLLIMYLILKDASLRAVSVYSIIFNIAFLETVLMIAFVFGNLSYILLDASDNVCRLTGLLLATCGGNGTPLYAYLAINRYLAFFNDHWFERLCSTRATVLILCYNAFTVSGTFIPWWPFYGYDHCHFCSINIVHSWHLTLYSGSTMGAAITVCGFIILYCNFKVSREIEKQRRRRRAVDRRRASVVCVKDNTLDDVRKLLYFHVFGEAFLFPAGIVRLIPALVDFPWIGRLSWLCLGLTFCITPYLVLLWMLPLRNAAVNFFRTLLTKFKRSGRVGQGVVVEQRERPAGKYRRSIVSLATSWGSFSR